MLHSKFKPFTHSRRPPALCSVLRAAHGRVRTVLVAASADTQQSSKTLEQSETKGKYRVVFLGTPEVAAGVLRDLLDASRQPDSLFEVSLVVSQPGKPKGRGNKTVPVPSPVEQLAREAGLAPEQILTPHRAKDEPFLAALEALQPDLAVTAAYGCMLPARFLAAPRLGTLNVHPSLLPAYRGAAPVQRALEDGVAESGVSVAYTVLACDAGPVLAQQKVAVDPNIQAPELLSHLFTLGSRLLLDSLPDVFAGRGQQMAVPQDESRVVHAAKLTREEAVLDFAACPALTLHNRVRAFAGWPGTAGRFVLRDEASGAEEALEVKVVRTRAPHSDAPPASAVAPGAPSPAPREVAFAGDAMLVPCAGGSVLEVLQVQPPTKKVMGAKDFKNGLRGKKLLVP